MTVSSTTNRKTFSGNGVTTSFATSPVVFFDTSDLVLTVVTDSTGASETLVENTDYTVTGGAGTTGTVSLAGGSSPYGAPAAGTTLVIRRVLPLTQDDDFLNNDINDAEVLEDRLDRLTMIDQQQSEEVGRALKVPASESEQDDIVVAGKAGYYLRRNVAGTAFELAVGDINTSTFTQSGTGAVERSVTAKLGELVSVADFGAVGDGVTDDTTALTNALATGAAFIPEGFNLLISSNVVMPAGSVLHGASRYTSKITLSGNIEGLTVVEQCEVRNLRIIGNSSMTTDSDGRAKACLLLGTPANDCYRFKVSNVIVGGKNTSLGDASNVRCAGAGLKGGNNFLGTVEDAYVFYNDIGIEGKFATGVTHNAMLYKQVECHSNRLGARFGILNAVVFDACTFENNEEEGLILGGCRSVDLIGAYFEGNNTTTAGARRADLLVEGDATFTGTADVGASVRIRGGYFSKGTNTLYGIYADKQRGIVIEYPYMVNYTGATKVISIGTTNTNGKVEGYYNNSSVASDIPVNFIYGNYEYTGVDERGTQFTPLPVSKRATNSGVVASGTVTLTAVAAGEIWEVHARGNVSSGFYYHGYAYISSGPAATVTNVAASNFSLSLSGSNLILTNTHGASTVDVTWTITKRLAA